VLGTDVSIATLVVLKYEAVASAASGDGNLTFVSTPTPHSESHSQPSSIFSFLQQTSACRFILPEPECKQQVLKTSANRVLRRIFGPKRAKVAEEC
jgi:hypothetical protein